MKSGRKESQYIVRAGCTRGKEKKNERAERNRKVGQTDGLGGGTYGRTDGQVDGQQSARTDRDRRTNRQTGNRRRELMTFFFTAFTTRAGKEN